MEIDINNLMATEIRGWEELEHGYASSGYVKVGYEPLLQKVWNPMGDIRQAMDCAEEFKIQGCRWWKLESTPTGTFHATVVMYGDCVFVEDRDYVMYEHETAEVALCMALLRAKGVIDYD